MACQLLIYLSVATELPAFSYNEVFGWSRQSCGNFKSVCYLQYMSCLSSDTLSLRFMTAPSWNLLPSALSHQHSRESYRTDRMVRNH
jgi:hypothetical protein